jgi:antitoxin component YwqK of YwqJK toxin-antitoxin module
MHGQGKLKKVVKITNGQHIFYSADKSVATEGTFKKGRFIEGKRYLYNDDGILTRVAVYKNSVYIGDMVPEKETKPKDSSSINQK